MSAIQGISVCICTYKRPEMLNRLVSALQNQITEELFNYNLVIVDNDRLESARQTVEEWQQKSNISTSYFVEPEQNIARARNRAVQYASGHYMGFIDDDELPENNWLLNLYKALVLYNADGVMGPVRPFFESEPPQWVLKGHFFDRPSHDTGHALTWRFTRTGNVLLKRAIFNNSDWFNEQLGSGGEDRDFFKRKIQQGFTFIWCNEAPVFETIPCQRWHRTVLLKRAYLRGKMALYSAPSKSSTVLKSLVAIFSYALLLPFLFVLGQHFFMRYLIKSVDHIGKVLTFAGFDLVKEKYISSHI